MGALSAAGTTRACRSPRRVIRPPPSATCMTRHTHPQWNAGHPSPRTDYVARIAAQIRSPPRTCDAGDALRVQTASSHRGGRRVHPVRAPQPQYALPRCAKVSGCCVHDEYRLLQRSVQPIRDDTYPCSHSVSCVFSTSSLAVQVDGGVTRDDVRYRRLAYYDRQAARHAFPAMPRPAGPPWLRSPRARREDGRRGLHCCTH